MFGRVRAIMRMALCPHGERALRYRSGRSGRDIARREMAAPDVRHDTDRGASTRGSHDHNLSLLLTALIGMRAARALYLGRCIRTPR